MWVTELAEHIIFFGLLICVFVFPLGVMTLRLACRAVGVSAPELVETVPITVRALGIHAGVGFAIVVLFRVILDILDLERSLRAVMLLTVAVPITLLAGMLLCGRYYARTLKECTFAQALLVWLVQLLIGSVVAGIIVGAVYLAVELTSVE